MISVVVPVYNVEAYLDECVQSILGQSYTDYELILVDDGSTDSSGNMCDDYAKADPRISVIHKTNGGLSDARNIGTKAARGDYVTYIDSDDLVSADYLEKLTGIVKELNVEIAVIGIECFTDGSKPKIKTSKKTDVFTGLEALKCALYQRGIDTSACALLVPISVALQFPFPVGRFHEDDFTTYKYYLSIKKVGVNYSKRYFYRHRKGSIMHSFSKASLDELDAADNLVDAMQSVSLDLIKAANSKKFSNYCQVLLSLKEKEEPSKDVINRIKTYIISERWNIITDMNVRFKNKAAAVSTLFGLRGLFLLNKIINRGAN